MKHKKQHIAYKKKHGRFIIDCNTDAFSTEEILTIEKHGHWFQALCDEKLIPYTYLQERFIRVYKRELEPFSVEENAWLKYNDQKDSEIKPGDSRNQLHLSHVNPFYTDEMYRSQKRMMYGEMKKNHRS